MLHHVMLMKMTDQGARTVTDIPARIEEGIKAWEAMGGKVLSFHATLDPYDYVAVVEAPSDEAGAA